MPKSPSLHILLIEDNPDHAALLLAHLSLTSYAHAEVVQHETLQGALNSLQHQSFHLLFIDLSLKDSSIAHTLDHLSHLSRFCPTIVLTSLDDKHTLLDIISKGADDCLPKVELNDVLLERIIHFNLDRWRLKQELISSKEAYKDLYHNSPNMLASIHVETGMVLNCNKILSEKLGYSREEIIGQTIFTLYHPDSLEAAQKAFRQFQTTGTVTNAELQMQCKDGKTIDLLLNTSAVRDDQGKIIHSRSTWIDVTAKKKAERQLQYMERLNRLIIETIPALLWLKDTNGVYLVCNPRFEQFFGAPASEIVGKTDYDFVSKELADFYTENDLKAAAAGQAVMNEEWITFASDGTKVLLKTTKTPLFNEQGQITGIMGIGHDITELYESVQKAEAANRAKSVFLSNMSHELRTPLNAILGYTQIFLGDESLTARQRKGIRTIHQAGEHLLLLINDILDISRIESGKLELLYTEFNLSSFLQGIKDIIQLRTKEKGINFVDQFQKLPTVIVADELRLRQVLLNLLSNAVKFTNSGHCTLEIRAEPQPAGRSRLTFVVEDSGCGIQAEDQHLVFEPFLQVGERLQHREGTGLGLAISQQLVRLMGSELQLISPVNRNPRNGEGKGSRFFFTIEVPTLDIQKGDKKTQERRKIIGYKRPNGKAVRVLVVDDKDSNRGVLRDTLEPLGFLIHEALDGSKVLALCKSFQPDIILMDLQMPKVDGFTATAQVKQSPRYKHIPVFAVTASIAEGEPLRRRCQQYGFNGYIHKPFAAEVLLEMMAGYLDLQLTYGIPEKEPLQEAIQIPPVELLDDLVFLVEVGEIQGITEKAMEIAALESGKYQAFSQRIQELIEEFQFTALSELIQGQKE